MGRKILITGCCGTIGQEILSSLIGQGGDAHLIGVDNNESGLFALSQKYRDKATFAFGDIRDEKRLEALCVGVDDIFHTAALKHVSSCELAPGEAVKTNIMGVENVISAAARMGVGRVLFTSSDKAVNPTNVMGTSKLMGERLMSAAQISNQDTIFTCTRFGNVLGSNGSVFLIFRKQIACGGPVTLTNPNMTRFVMSTKDAVRLVLESMELARGGEVFVSRMRAMSIGHLAQVMIEQLAPLYGYKPADIPIEIIGAKPGEKLYEELLTEEESSRALHLENFYVILPAFRNFYGVNYSYQNSFPHPNGVIYRSNDQKLMTREEITEYLAASGLIQTMV